LRPVGLGWSRFGPSSASLTEPIAALTPYPRRVPVKPGEGSRGAAA